MNIQTAIKTVISGQNLDQQDMTRVMQLIMTGECTPAQIGGFLVGLRMNPPGNAPGFAPGNPGTA